MEKQKSAVEKGVDDPNKPKPGTGVARPDPTRDPIGGLPPSWDRPAWERLRSIGKPKKGTDEGGWGGSESGGSSTAGVRGAKVDWDLVVGGGHTDPGREGETHSGPRRPKHVGKMKVRKPTSDDPSVFGPKGLGKSAATDGGMK